MSEAVQQNTKPRMIVLDVMSWQQGARDSPTLLPWDKLESTLLPELGDVRISLLLTAAQRASLTEGLQARVECIEVADANVRRAALAPLIAEGALIVSAQVTHPYERWLPARLATDASMGLRFAPANGLQRYLESGIVKALPTVTKPLSSLLLDEREAPDVVPAFADIMALMPLPGSPFELYERMATLCDEREVVHLDRYLHARLRELVLFLDMEDSDIDAALEQRQLTMRVRHAWAQELEITAVASREEQEEGRRAAVQAVLGFPPKEIDPDAAQAQLDVLPYAKEQTTLAYKMGSEIHVLNPDPEQAQLLSGVPHVHVHQKAERPPPLLQILDELEDWTLDHYRQDPQLDGLIQHLTHDVSDVQLHKYARAYISYLGFPPPSPLPKPLRDWRPALQKLLALQPPATSIRFQYPTSSQPNVREGLIIIEGTSRPDKTLYSPMNCIATPAAAVTLLRGRRYVQVDLSRAMLGYEHNDIFSRGDEYDGVPTELLERKRPRHRNTSPAPRPTTPTPTPKDRALYVEYPFRHAGLAEEYVVFPLRQTTEGSVASSHLKEFLTFYQLNLSLKRISDLLAQNPEGKVSKALADEVVPQIKKIFQPLKRQHVYFTMREHSPFPVRVQWRILDRQVAAIWLSLRQALQSAEALQLHDDRVVIPVSAGIFAECAVRPLAPGVTLPTEVSLCATNDDLAAPSERAGLVRAHPLYESNFQGQHSITGLHLPLPLQIIGEGLCAEIRFFASPIQAAFPPPTPWGSPSPTHNPAKEEG